MGGRRILNLVHLNISIKPIHFIYTVICFVVPLNYNFKNMNLKFFSKKSMENRHARKYTLTTGFYKHQMR